MMKILNVTVSLTVAGIDLTEEVLNSYSISSEADLIRAALDWKYTLQSSGAYRADFNAAPDEKIVCIDDEEIDRDPMDDAEIQDFASAIYDGGWREEDRDDIIREYQLTNDEMDRVADRFRYYESKKKEEE